MAAAIYNQLIVTFLDKNGGMADTFWTTQDQSSSPGSGLVAVASAAQACSDAAVIGVQFQSTLRIDATPGDGPYCTVFDRARLLSRITATGRPARQEIIAPKASLFLGDLVTVDLTNVDIMALNVQLMGKIGDKSGNPQGPITRGLRASAKVNP